MLFLEGNDDVFSALPVQGANACVMRSTTVWCARTHELAILHMHAKLLTKRKVYLRETVPRRGGRVVSRVNANLRSNTTREKPRRASAFLVAAARRSARHSGKYLPPANGRRYSTVTDFARFLGLSGSCPSARET